MKKGTIDNKYKEPVKILRDLVHGYINLTKFEIKLIDTAHFQRLRDIRQMTGQLVYPTARHSRFEHSLGVMQLTRRAIKHIDANGYIENIPDSPVHFDDKDIFNAAVAALLHDIGHCPFSHLGETQFEIFDVRQALKAIQEDLKEDLTENVFDCLYKHTCVHELLSCYIILTKYRDILKDTGIADFELIIRSIIGSLLPEENKNIKKNVIIRLINSDMLDMDKLDYIMRDTFFTGLNAPDLPPIFSPT